MLMFTSTHRAMMALNRTVIAQQDAENTKLRQDNFALDQKARKLGKLSAETLAERDGLQAKIDRMTIGNLPKRAPKANGAADARAGREA